MVLREISDRKSFAYARSPTIPAPHDLPAVVLLQPVDGIRASPFPGNFCGFAANEWGVLQVSGIESRKASNGADFRVFLKEGLSEVEG